MLKVEQIQCTNCCFTKNNEILQSTSWPTKNITGINRTNRFTLNSFDCSAATSSVLCYLHVLLKCLFTELCDTTENQLLHVDGIVLVKCYLVQTNYAQDLSTEGLRAYLTLYNVFKLTVYSVYTYAGEVFRVSFFL